MQSYQAITDRRQKLKSLAKMGLQGHVWYAFAACLLPGLLTWLLRLLPSDLFLLHVLIADGYIIGISVFMTVISAVASIFATGPLQVGVAGYFVKLLTHTDPMPSPLSVCDCFGPTYIRCMLGMAIKHAVALLAAAIPLLLLLTPGAISIVTIENIDVMIPSTIAYITMSVSFLLYAYMDTIFSMVPYILSDHPFITMRQALQQSIALTRGHVLELIIMQVSFLLWMGLVAISFLLGALYVYPYIEATMAAYYLEFTNRKPLLEDNKDIYEA